MSRPRAPFEAAAEFGMSVEDFVESDAYAAGVADGSISPWVRTGPSHDASAAAVDPDPESAPVKAKRK